MTDLDDRFAAAAAAAATEISPIDDIRATADYRTDGVRIVIERGLHAIAAGAERSQWPDEPVLLGPGAGIFGGAGAVFAQIPSVLRKQGTFLLYGHGHAGASHHKGGGGAGVGRAARQRRAPAAVLALQAGERG